MTRNRKVAIWAIVILGLGGVWAATRIAVRLYRKHRPITLRGAVIKQDYDPRKQSPIANVEVSSPDGLVVHDAKSDFSGSFRLTLRPDVKMGQPIRLAFRHPDFQPLDLKETLNNKLYVVRMMPLHGEVEAQLNEAEVGVANVLVRYSTEATNTENIGSAVKTFQVVNSGNVPCFQHARVRLTTNGRPRWPLHLSMQEKGMYSGMRSDVHCGALSIYSG